MVVGRVSVLALVLAFGCKFDTRNFDDRRCTQSVQCDPEEECVHEVCALRGCGLAEDCEGGASCGYQFRCDTNTCIRQECTTDEECRAPYACDRGFCSTICTAFDTASGHQAEASSVYNAVVAVSPTSGRDVSFTVSAANILAVRDRDFTVDTETYVVPAGATSLVIPVQLIDNPYREADKNFSITIVTPSFGILGNPSTHEITIDNDDEKPGVLFDPEQSDTSGLEGGANNTNITCQVVLTEAVATDVIVTIDTAGSTAMIGAAQDARIITPAGPPMVTIPAGSLSTTFQLRVLGDAIVEPDEFVVMKLLLTSGDVVVSPTPRIHTIKNDD